MLVKMRYCDQKSIHVCKIYDVKSVQKPEVVTDHDLQIKDHDLDHWQQSRKDLDHDLDQLSF